MPLASLNMGNVNTAYPVYTVPSLKQTSFSVTVCNRNTSSNANGGVVKIRLALATAGNPPDPAGANWIEYDTPLQPNTPLERTGLVAQAGEALYAQTDTLGVNVVVYGFEEYPSASLSQDSTISVTDIDAGAG